MRGMQEQTLNEPGYVAWYRAAERRESRRRGRAPRVIQNNPMALLDIACQTGADHHDKNHCEGTFAAKIRNAYTAQGFFIVAEGWLCGDGRADVVASDGNTLVFGFAEHFPELPDAAAVPWAVFPGRNQSAEIARAFLEEYRWFGLPIRFDAIAYGRQREEEKILIRSSSARTSSVEATPDAALSRGALSNQ